MTPSSSFLSTLCLISTLLSIHVPFVDSISRHAVEFTNDSGQQVAMDWYNPSTGEKIEFHHLAEGETISVNSFTNHTFVLRFDNDTCADRECRSTIFTVNDNGDQGKYSVVTFDQRIFFLCVVSCQFCKSIYDRDQSSKSKMALSWSTGIPAPSRAASQWTLSRSATK